MNTQSGKSRLWVGDSALAATLAAFGARVDQAAVVKWIENANRFEYRYSEWEVIQNRDKVWFGMYSGQTGNLLLFAAFDRG